MVLVHHTLGLYNVLRTLTTIEDPNDDLVESWKEHQDRAYQGLVKLLKASDGLPDADYLPLNETFASLGQELSRWNNGKIEDAEEVRSAGHHYCQRSRTNKPHRSSTLCCMPSRGRFKKPLSRSFTPISLACKSRSHSMQL